MSGPVPCTRARRERRGCVGMRPGGLVQPFPAGGQGPGKGPVLVGRQGARRPAGRCEVELFPLTIEVRVNRQSRRGEDIIAPLANTTTTIAPLTSTTTTIAPLISTTTLPVCRRSASGAGAAGVLERAHALSGGEHCGSEGLILAT